PPLPLPASLPALATMARVKAVRAAVIAQPGPARAAGGVASLPKGRQVEAEAVLVITA
ncbi:RidA family protein, partial [Neisseria sp. P0001.S008]